MSSRKAGIGFIFVTLFLDILGIGVVVPISPELVKGFAKTFLAGSPDTMLAFFLRDGMTVDELGSVSFGWLMASYAAMQFLFSPTIGGLSDRFGRRPVLLASNVGQGLAYVWMAVAPTLSWLWLGRLVAGITGASIGTATAYIADVTPPEKRAQNFGLVGIAFGLGFIFGPLLGGVLGQLDLRYPFYASAVLAMANAAWGFFVLPESLSVETRRPFSLKNANPFGTLKTLGRYPLVLSMSVSVVLFNLGQRALESTWVLTSAYRYHWDKRDAGISLAVVGLSGAIVQGGLVRRLLPILGERKALIVGGLMSVLAFIGYGFAPTGLIVYLIIPFGAFGGLAQPAGQAILSKAVPATEQGMLQGALVSLVALTQIAGPPIGTGLFSYFISKDAPVQLPGVSFLFGALCMALGVAYAMRTFGKYPAPSVIAEAEITPG